MNNPLSQESPQIFSEKMESDEAQLYQEEMNLKTEAHSQLV